MSEIVCAGLNPQPIASRAPRAVPVSDAADSRWVVRHARSGHPRLWLVCLPHAGAGASQFAAWSRLLPPEVGVLALQLPGRENRMHDHPYTRLEALVDVLAEAVMPHLDVPFALFGHSMGAWLSYELARRLQQRYGVRPRHLFVSGRRAPHLPSTQPIIHRLPDPLFVDELGRRYGGLPAVILNEPELLRLFLPTLRADLEMVETYRHRAGEPVSCPISAFGGLEDAAVQAADLASWRDRTSSEFNLRMFPGGHFYVQSARDELVATVARDLTASLSAMVAVS
jgi:medium-chain acyl-[acyl-carrier-protein] hydrolase